MRKQRPIVFVIKLTNNLFGLVLTVMGFCNIERILFVQHHSVNAAVLMLLRAVLILLVLMKTAI